MRLIDADTLKRKAQKLSTEAWKTNRVARVHSILNQFIDWIEGMPTIDAVEVVRCKDCQYGHMTYNGECKYCDVWEGDKLYLDSNFYCGFGKRREKSEVEE